MSRITLSHNTNKRIVHTLLAPTAVVTYEQIRLYRLPLRKTRGDRIYCINCQRFQLSVSWISQRKYRECNKFRVLCVLWLAHTYKDPIKIIMVCKKLFAFYKDHFALSSNSGFQSIEVSHCRLLLTKHILLAKKVLVLSVRLQSFFFLIPFSSKEIK